MDETFRKALVPVSYPNEILTYPCNAFSVDSTRVSSFDPKKHNSILVSRFCSENMNGNGTTIPQLGSFITHFRLDKDAYEVSFEVNGIRVKAWKHLVANMWYNIHDCPVNVYSTPYGQRFIRVVYNEGEEIALGRGVEIQYIACDHETHEQVITASGIRVN